MIRQVSTDSIELLNQLVLGENEGAMFVKFVLLKQPTLSAGAASAKIAEAPATLLLGNLDELKAQLSTWLSEAIETYKGNKNGN